VAVADNFQSRPDGIISLWPIWKSTRTLFFGFGFAVKRLAAPYSQSVTVATVASATAVRNAVRKCGGGSEMTLTVATNKANRAGSPIAVVRSDIGSGRYDLL
jgi:hypothetical protein